MTIRITKVTPIASKRAEPTSETGIEIFPGEFREVESDWYQADLDDLKELLEGKDLGYREYHLMRKAVGFESGLLVGLLIWGGTEGLKVLTAWLLAREGRKVRVKFKDGTEIEARSVKELEQIRDKFLLDANDDAGDE